MKGNNSSYKNKKILVVRQILKQTTLKYKQNSTSVILIDTE